jgi:hypothetical protein
MSMSRITAVAALAIGLAIGAGGTTVALAGTAETVWVPPGDTVVKVTGDAANGFGIYFYDGSEIFPPTDPEALAECSEYSTYVERERCKTEVRTWYRDLKTMKRAINWAHYSEQHAT